MACTATWGVPLSGRHTFSPCGVRLCCTVQRVVQACTATTLEVDYAELQMSCWHTRQLYGVARYATVYFGTVWHVMPRCTLARTTIMLCLARIANESGDSCRAGATTSPLIIILCLQHTAFLLFTPFLVRNVIVRGSRYSCCLGYRLLFPYMILILLFFKKN